MEVYDVIKGTELSDTLKVVGTGGTASMTGHKAGFIRCLGRETGETIAMGGLPFALQRVASKACVS